MKQLQRRRWKYSFALLVSLSVGSLLTASSVFAYQEVTVTDGGTITGKVTLKGTNRAPRGLIFAFFLNRAFSVGFPKAQGFRSLKELPARGNPACKVVLSSRFGFH